MTYTIQQLKDFSDEKILEVFKPLQGKFEESTLSWVHSEYMWWDMFDVIEPLLSDEEKKEFVDEWTEEDNGLDVEGETFDEIIGEQEWLMEDVSVHHWTEPKFSDMCSIWLFHYLMEGKVDGDGEVLVDFLNEQEEN